MFFNYQKRKEQPIVLRNFIEFDLLTLKNVLQAQKQENRVNEKSLYFLEKNFLEFNKNQKEIQTKIFEKEGDSEGSIQDFNIFTFALTISVYSVIMICSLFLINKLFTFKERLLLIIARIHLQECDQHSQIYTQIFKQISDPSEQWLSADFITLIFFQKKSINNSNDGNNPTKIQSLQKKIQLKQEDKTSSSQRHTQVSVSTPTNKKQKKTKRNQMLSTSFTQQRLSKWKRVLLCIAVCLLCILFFSIINLIVKNFYNSFEEPVHVHQHSQQSVEAIIQVKALSEILSTYRYLLTNQAVYPVLNIQDIYTFYYENVKELSLYTTDFLNEVDSLTQYSSSQTKIVNSLFKESLCVSSSQNGETLNNYNVDCSLLTDSQIEIFQSGISGIINRYLQLFQSYVDLFSNALPYDQHKAYLFAYQGSSDYFDLLIDKSNDINQLLNTFKDVITNICSDFTSSLRTQVLYYSIIFGSILISFLFGIIIFSKIYIVQQLRRLTFGLTLIPYSKLQEESTIQILKQLLKS